MQVTTAAEPAPAPVHQTGAPNMIVQLPDEHDTKLREAECVQNQRGQPATDQLEQRGSSLQQSDVGTAMPSVRRSTQVHGNQSTQTPIVPAVFPCGSEMRSRTPRPAPRPNRSDLLQAASGGTTAAATEPHQHPTTSASWGNSNPLNIGANLWRQMKRIANPTFSGDKHAYATCKVAFVPCIDIAPATPEFNIFAAPTIPIGSGPEGN